MKSLQLGADDYMVKRFSFEELLARIYARIRNQFHEDRLSQHIYNVGTGQGYSVKEIIQQAGQITNRVISSNAEVRRAGDPAVLIADSQSIQKQLGWKPQYSDLHTIIQTAWKWHQANPSGYKKKSVV